MTRNRVDELLNQYGDTTDYVVALEVEVEKLVALVEKLRETNEFLENLLLERGETN